MGIVRGAGAAEILAKVGGLGAGCAGLYVGEVDTDDGFGFRLGLKLSQLGVRLVGDDFGLGQVAGPVIAFGEVDDIALGKVVGGHDLGGEFTWHVRQAPAVMRKSLLGRRAG